MEELKNFIVNIKPLMMKIKNKEELTESELQTILQFYLETASAIRNK